jgi:hypothetical protein
LELFPHRRQYAHDGLEIRANYTICNSMTIANHGESYNPGKGRSAVLQPSAPPLSLLRRPWFKNKIVSDDGWSLSFSGSSWRIDCYDYFEEGRHLILGGEGASGQMDIFLTKTLRWNDPCDVTLDDETRGRVLYNITSALQWAGFSVGFFELEDSNGSE